MNDSSDNEVADQSRPIRSYVLRGGRLTPGQQRAMDELWPLFGIPDEPGCISSVECFGRDAPMVADIGFGNGETTWQMAQGEPEKNFLGIEVHPPGVGHLLLQLEQHGVENVRIAHADAVTFLLGRVNDASLSEVRIYFPDPWPKKRHHKRRIVQADFMVLLARKIAPGGLLHLATDWQPYADWMLEVISANADFENLSPDGNWVEQPPWRPSTKYERRGENLGHEVRDLLFRRGA